ncbi:MAG: glycosyltransferase family 4 protein [Crocinitomicaceae bacterium]
MRVLILCNKAPFPPNDGSSIAIYNMAKGLEECGIDLHLFSLNTKKHFKSDREVLKGFPKSTSYQSIYLDTNPTILGAISNLFSNQSYFVSRFYDRKVEKQLEWKLNETDFDIVQLEGVFMATYIPLIRRFTKAKIVLRAHNIEYLIWDRHIKMSKSWLQKFYLGIQTKRLRNFEHEIFGSVDAIVPITDADAVYISELSSSPIHSAITGVDFKKYPKTNSTDFNPLSIFHFGSMDWIPNQEAVDWFLEKCWPVISSQVPKVKFVIAGRNIPKRFKLLANERIIVRENVPDAAEIYNQFNVMIVPVLSGSGMRIKIVEGMCFGKAIVSTQIGAEGINAVHEKNILLHDNSLDFANAVIRLLKNENDRLVLEENAYSFARDHFDYLSVAGKLVAFYNQLIQTS